MKTEFYLYAESKRLRALLGTFSNFYESQRVGWENYKKYNNNLMIYTAIEVLPINAVCIKENNKVKIQGKI